MRTSEVSASGNSQPAAAASLPKIRAATATFGTRSALVTSDWFERTHRIAKEYAVLVLTRKPQQQIQIGDDVIVTILQVKGQQIRVGIEAPRKVRVVRGEIRDKPLKEDKVMQEPMEEPTSLRRLAARAVNRVTVVSDNANDAFSSPESPALPDAPHDQLTQPLSRRRAPSASSATLVRRPQRLGPSSLRAFSGRAARF